MIQESIKTKIRNKLSNLLKETQSLRTELTQIKQLHKNFRNFYEENSKILCDQRAKIKRKNERIACRIQNDDENNKENINTCNTQNGRMRNQKNSLGKMKVRREVECEVEYKNDRFKDESQSLKSKILTELCEIKKIEKREQAARKQNQKMKAYNSQQKRYHESLSKNSKNASLNKSFQNLRNINYPKNTSSSKMLNLTQNTNNLYEQPIQLPLSLVSSSSTSLKCANGHIFYEGDLNDIGLPHGHGRLEICCELMNKVVCRNSLKHAMYYQGQFSNGLFNGYGTLSYKGGVKYVGQFECGKRSGRGSLYHGGKVETAKWKDDTFISIL